MIARGPFPGMVRLHLQALIDEAYRRGRYEQTTDYSPPPAPPLDPDDAEWATGLVERWRKKLAEARPSAPGA